jgi:predicted small metal-binding protein
MESPCQINNFARSKFPAGGNSRGSDVARTRHRSDRLAVHNSQVQTEHCEQCAEAIMARMYIDCRDYPSEMNCTVAISADSKKEILDAAVQHAVAVHGHRDSPQLREQIASMIKSQ